LQENLVAPFFIFQILCLLLWSLDDYWYYSLFTMLMLFFFEALMANQRLAGLQTLRAMR
jgi:cation-transporting ATPase 13A1